jgi:hypothetical protein
MRFWTRLLLILLLLAGGAAIGGYVFLETLERQWALYRVATAPSAAAVQREFAWFEHGPDAPARLRELVSHWGTGHPQFDLALANYIARPECSEALRETFSHEFAWREELLPRWAHFWTWHAAGSPEEEINSLAEYFQILSTSDPPKTIPWREVLDLQAIFTITCQPRLAHRLSPQNWPERFRQWQQRQATPLRNVPRPTKPFPEGDGWRVAGGGSRR